MIEEINAYKLDVEGLLKEMDNVPFGNSAFQNAQFTDGHETPCRRYRWCLLQISSKLNALSECKFRRARIQIDIEEICDKLERAKGFNKRRIEIDLEEKRFNLRNEEKLIKDAIIEIETFKAELATLPKPTREEFEKDEYTYWVKRLTNDAVREMVSSGTISVGTIESLNQIGVAIRRNTEGRLEFINNPLIPEPKPAKELAAAEEAPQVEESVAPTT